MKLREFVSEQMQTIFEALRQGQNPPLGTYDEVALKESLRRPQVQIGTTHHRPHSVIFEYIFNDPNLGPAIFVVEIETPESVVYLPVPDWVIEDVWQGEVTGSFCFRSEAEQLIEEYRRRVFDPNQNAPHFEERQPAKRRE